MTDERLAQVKAETVRAQHAREPVTMHSWELLQILNELEQRRADERAPSAGEATPEA